MKYRATSLALIVLALASASLAQVQNWPTERPPRPLPAREVKFPPYEFRTLPNGLQVIAVSHHEQPAVSLRLIIRAGGAQDPADKPGAASLAATLLDQGTTTKSAEQIANAIDSIGGALAVGSGSDLTSVSAAVMKGSLDVALQLVADVARNPAYSPQEIERQRQQMMSAMKVSHEDPDYIAGTVFDRLVYGFHPYGKPDAGTPSSLASLTRDDLMAFHKRWFAPNNAVLAVVGDVTPAQAFAGAEKAFGSWPKVALTPVAGTDVPPSARRVIVIDRPGAVQTEIRVGNIGLPRKHKDYLALDIAVKILGGEGGNRLHRVLRSERGLTYGAEADVHALMDTGDIVASTDTKSETTAETLRLIVDEISKLRRERVQQRELADAQAYLTGSFPLTIETPSAIALQVLNAVFYGLDLEELQNFRERVNAITPEDIQRVAQQYLHQDRLSIVLVGDSKVFGKDLAGAGFEQVERIPLSDLDFTAPNLRRKQPPPALVSGHGSTRFNTARLATVPHGSTRATVPHGSTRATVPHGSTRGTVQYTATPATAHHGATRATVQHGSTRGTVQYTATPAAVHHGATRATVQHGATPARGLGPKPPAAKGQDATDADARALVAKAIAARGGLERLRSIKTVKATADMVFATQAGPARVVATTQVKYPAQFRVDARGPDGRSMQGFDNGSAWVGDDTGVRDAPPEYTKLLQATIQRDNVGLLLALHDNRITGRRVADVKFEGMMMPALEVQLATAGRLTLVFDGATGLLAAQRYGGTPGDPATEESFFDYKDVQGLKVAFRVRVRVEGQPPFERTIRSIDFNVPVDAALFGKPKA